MQIDDDVERINRLLMPLLGSHRLINEWWDSPNHAFGELTPADMWEINRKRVFEYVQSQYRGDYL